jgi:endonuclease YncB( thermonuclease family)
LLLAVTSARAAEPDRTIRLSQPVATVWDGDTFEADLDGNGRLDLPRERVRLLYVDTPELHESPKGQDLEHGLPAKAALEVLLRAQPITLTVRAGNDRDAHGRTLARVMAGGVDVNLALVRQGYSYFDTRFAVPGDYDAFAQAEAEAFEARRGIWGDAPSRKRYLERLRREGKTPRSASNRLYRPGIVAPQALDPRRDGNRYITTEGVLTQTRPASNKGCVAALVGHGGIPVTLYAAPPVERRLALCGWPLQSKVRVEGFYRRYHDRWEVAVNHAARR